MIFATAARACYALTVLCSSGCGDRRKIFGSRVTTRLVGPNTKKDKCHLRGEAEWADLMRSAKAGDGGGL